jgi:hypothetical protein
LPFDFVASPLAILVEKGDQFIVNDALGYVVLDVFENFVFLHSYWIWCLNFGG